MKRIPKGLKEQIKTGKSEILTLDKLGKFLRASKPYYVDLLPIELGGPDGNAVLKDTDTKTE